MNLNKHKPIVFSMAAAGLLLVGLFMILNGTPQTARADPGDLFVTVAGGGNCTQPKPCDLQTALSIASDGDTIYIAGSTYTGSGAAVITVTKSIILYGGWNGAGSGVPVRDPQAYPTTLDGESQRRVIILDGSLSTISTTVDGLIIANGNAVNVSIDPGRGGGIYSIHATALIANNVITNNIAGPPNGGGNAYGGGIYLHKVDGTAVITANQVISNTANANGRGYGGGIYLSNSADGVQVVNNVVLSNTAVITGGRGYGGGISFSGDGVSVTGNQIAYNVAYRGATWQNSDGGGIYCEGSDDATIRDNIVQYNVVNLNAIDGSGGGISLYMCDRTILANNLLEGNATSGVQYGRGGALKTYYARDLTLDANRIMDNAARYGGGLYLGRDTTFTMTNNIVAENYGGAYGGGMAFETGSSEPVTGTLFHNTFAANDKGSGNGRIAIYIDDPYVNLELTNNLIYSHTYGVYIVTNSSVTLDQTLFYANSDGDTGGAGTIVNSDPITGQHPLLRADYDLQADSPAIDAGLTVPWLTTDIDGNPRPYGSGYDIGAYEFSGDHWDVYMPLVVR